MSAHVPPMPLILGEDNRQGGDSATLTTSDAPPTRMIDAVPGGNDGSLYGTRSAPSTYSRKRRRISAEIYSAAGDRFIAYGSDKDIRVAYRAISRPQVLPPRSKRARQAIEAFAQHDSTNTLQGRVRFANARYKEILSSAYAPSASTDSTTGRSRIFSYHHPLATSEGGSLTTRPDFQLDSVLHSAYDMVSLPLTTRKQLAAPTKRMRHISTTAYKVLDAPDLEDNFYLNLMDWSNKDMLAVVLGKSIYVYDVERGKVQKLLSFGELESSGLYPSSVRWIEDGNVLAVGNRRGDLTTYDVQTGLKLRTISGHTKRIGNISSMGSLIATGSADCTILLRDLRAPIPVKRITAHLAEVCGLKFGTFGDPVLASGGDDCRLYVWDLRSSATNSTSKQVPQTTIHRGRLSTSSLTNAADLSPPRYSSILTRSMAAKANSPTPLLSLTEHRAAVKGLAWSPHARGLLASGGGKQDPIIRFWNTTIGYKIDQLQCQSQVTNLAWSITSDELVSTHGYGAATVPGVVTVWHYPTRTSNISFIAHSGRVLYLATSPHGQTIATASCDESLRFFEIFPPKQKEPYVRGADLMGKIR